MPKNEDQLSLDIWTVCQVYGHQFFDVGGGQLRCPDCGELTEVDESEVLEYDCV